MSGFENEQDQVSVLIRPTTEEDCVKEIRVLLQRRKQLKWWQFSKRSRINWEIRFWLQTWQGLIPRWEK